MMRHQAWNIGYIFLMLSLLMGSVKATAGEYVPPPSLWYYAEPRAADDEAKKLSGALEGGQQSSAGTVVFQSATGAGNVTYDTGNSEAVENVNYQYLSSKGTIIAKQIHSYTGYDRYLDYRIWAFVLNDYEKNEPKKIVSNVLTGGGFKYDLLRNSFWKLNLGAAYLFRNQKTTTDLSDQDKVVSYRLKFNIYQKGFDSYIIGFYQPSLTDRTRVWSVDVGINLKTTDSFYIKTGYLYRYDSEPLDPSIELWDQQSYVRLGIKF